MTQWLFICDVNLSIEEDLSILLAKEYNLKTHIKVSCLHDEVDSKNGENLKAWAEPENEYNKYAVAVERCDDVIGHLSNLSPFRIFYLQAMKTAVGLK